MFCPGMLVNPREVEEEDHMVAGKLFLPCNTNYMLDLEYVFLCVDALHTKTEHHSVCKNDGDLQGLRVEI